MTRRKQGLCSAEENNSQLPAVDNFVGQIQTLPPIERWRPIQRLAYDSAIGVDALYELILALPLTKRDQLSRLIANNFELATRLSYCQLRSQ